MNRFYPGLEVVCVCDRILDPDPREAYPVRGGHYIVRDVYGPYPDGRLGIRLREIVNPVIHPDGECTFDEVKFRPVKRETIEIFRAMCVSTKPLVEVD